MSLTAADVAEILRLLEQSSFDELNLEMNGMKLSLKRTSAVSGTHGARSALEGGPASGEANRVATSGNSAAAPAGATSTPSAAHSGATGSAAPDQAATSCEPPRATPSDPNVHDVPSPLLGTFYRAPKPGAPPFVEVGSTVTEESIVAIIEVMKLMNTVRAGVRGTVVEILPADGTLVEYDQPILRIRKSG